MGKKYLATHPNPTHLIFLSYTLFPCNLLTKEKESRCGSCSVTVCPTVHPFVYTSLLASVHCNESLVWGEVLLHGPYWILIRTPLKYSVVALHYGNPVALDQPSSCTPEVHRRVDDGVHHLKALDLGLVGS